MSRMASTAAHTAAVHVALTLVCRTFSSGEIGALPGATAAAGTAAGSGSGPVPGGPAGATPVPGGGMGVPPGPGACPVAGGGTGAVPVAGDVAGPGSMSGVGSGAASVDGSGGRPGTPDPVGVTAPSPVANDRHTGVGLRVPHTGTYPLSTQLNRECPHPAACPELRCNRPVRFCWRAAEGAQLGRWRRGLSNLTGRTGEGGAG
jgi:hypothetical protein